MHKQPFTIFALVTIAVLVLSACGPAASSPTPTQESLDAIRTQAAQTAFAQLTQIALTQPPTATSTDTPAATATSTPTATLFATLAPPVLTSCAKSTFIKDVTIPDGTTLAVGALFTKTWRVQNSGTCPWTTSFKLAFSYGDAMGGVTLVMPNTVAVGAQVDLSVKMKVPNKTGKLTGVWALVDDKNQPFGPVLTVVINVGTASPTPTGSLTITPTPSRTSTPNPGFTATSTPTPTDTLPPANTPTPTSTPTPTNPPPPTETPTPTPNPT